MSHERDNPNNKASYYPVVSKTVALEVETLWHQQPDLMRTRTRAQIGEFSPDLIVLLDIMEKFGDSASDLPKGTGQTISEGAMQSFSMLYKQAAAEHRQLMHLQFDPYEFSDRELPQWGLLETPTKPGRRITTRDIVKPFLQQNRELANTILEDSRTRDNSLYFIAGAALVSQLYYEASLPQEKS